VDDQLRRDVSLLHANICQALADPNRILILYALAEGPKFVNELSEFTDAPQSTVSRHLKVLRDRQLVIAQREGTAVRYSLADTRVIDALDTMRSVLGDALDRQAKLAQSLT
jgi:DNA-binding transcriptional ArsR family regulator